MAETTIKQTATDIVQAGAIILLSTAAVVMVYFGLTAFVGLFP